MPKNLYSRSQDSVWLVCGTVESSHNHIFVITSNDFNLSCDPKKKPHLEVWTGAPNNFPRGWGRTPANQSLGENLHFIESSSMTANVVTPRTSHGAN